MSFAEDVRAWAEKTQATGDQVLRATGLELLRRVVLRSPVGNPELWAANAHAIAARKSFNAKAAATNAILDTNPVLRETLRLKSGGPLKRQKPLSARAIAKRVPLKAGAGYVGGRFRGSWQVSFDAPATGEPGGVDPSGNSTISAGSSILAAARLGKTIYIVSNVPYAIPIEYGHSKQSPAGVVRVTAAEFVGIVDTQVRTIGI